MRLAAGRFYGETLKVQKVAGFGLTEAIYPPHYKIPQHSHERPYFGLVLLGEYTETYGNNSRTCTPSTLVFHPSDERHSQNFYGKQTHLFRIEVCPNWLDQISKRVPIQNKAADFHENPACQLATRLYYEFRDMDEVSPLVIEGLALEIIGEVSRPSRPSAVLAPRWLRQAREMIHERAFERLTLSQIAQAVGVHPVYLAREFRRVFKCTVGEYIRKLRIQAACREMIRPDSSLAGIAAACGFHDQSHFSKAFKQVMHMTPAAYRARLFSR